MIAVAVVAVLVIVAAGAYLVMSGDKRETLVVETSPDFAPFDYMVGSEYVGIDMDIVRAVCDEMGYNVEFRTNSFDSILMSVPLGKADIGASGFTISEERAKSVLFSTPYAQINQVSLLPSTLTSRRWRTYTERRSPFRTVPLGPIMQRRSAIM